MEHADCCDAPRSADFEGQDRGVWRAVEVAASVCSKQMRLLVIVPSAIVLFGNIAGYSFETAYPLQVFL